MAGGHKLKSRNHNWRPSKTHCVGGLKPAVDRYASCGPPRGGG